MELLQAMPAIKQLTQGFVKLTEKKMATWGKRSAFLCSARDRSLRYFFFSVNPRINLSSVTVLSRFSGCTCLITAFINVFNLRPFPLLALWTMKSNVIHLAELTEAWEVWNSSFVVANSSLVANCSIISRFATSSSAVYPTVCYCSLFLNSSFIFSYWLRFIWLMSNSFSTIFFLINFLYFAFLPTYRNCFSSPSFSSSLMFLSSWMVCLLLCAGKSFGIGLLFRVGTSHQNVWPIDCCGLIFGIKSW